MSQMRVPAPREWDMLLSAAQKNLPEQIRKMVNSGVDANHANAIGQTALHVASLWANVEAVQTLLELGANCNAQNHMSGATPLHMVARSGKGSLEQRLQVIDLLMAAGADVGYADSIGLAVHTIQLTPGDGDPDEQTRILVQKMQPHRPELFTAILERNVPAVKEILSEDADGTATATEFLGQTPVSQTVDELVTVVTSDQNEKAFEAENLFSILEVLLDNGGDAGGVKKNESSNDRLSLDELGEPPLHKVVSSLREIYKQPADTQSSAIEDALKKTVILLKEHGAPVSPETSQLLHQAARRNEVTFARFLVECLEVDPNTVGRQGMTPLHFAARSGQTDIMHYLLELPGINVDAKDDRGKTALDMARVNDKEEAVRLLEERL